MITIAEPYTSGVTLTINETSVFLDYQDLNEFIDCIKRYLILGVNYGY